VTSIRSEPCVLRFGPWKGNWDWSDILMPLTENDADNSFRGAKRYSWPKKEQFPNTVLAQ
jgi:hypothetical protein